MKEVGITFSNQEDRLEWKLEGTGNFIGGTRSSPRVKLFAWKMG